MPLKFAQTLIDFMKDIQKTCPSEDDEESDKLKQIIADLYYCEYLIIYLFVAYVSKINCFHFNKGSVSTRQLIKSVDSPFSRNSNATMSKLICERSGDSSKRYTIEIIDNPDGRKTWKKATLVIDDTHMSIECIELGNSINLKHVTSAKMSDKCKLPVKF